LNILCIASAGTGHLDFGGMGFVKLAKKLMARGHEVTWISSQQQVERLRSFGFSAEHQPVIDALNLNYFIPANAIESNRQNYLWLVQQIRLFQALIASRKPDLILFDRLLTYAAMAAEELGMPYVSVGTPGGYWRKDQSGTHPGDAPIQEYRQWGETIKSDLGWKKARLDSFWINSPLLNICFIGRDFYAPPSGTPSAQVHHFTDKPSRSDGARFGISFGNEGIEAILKSFMECLFRHDWVKEPLDIFLGNKKYLLQEMQPKYPSERVQFHEWVDFSEHFPKLKCLAFFGGIGTIWHCIDNYLPMLVVPGMIGDQLYNGRIVSERGLGECFTMSESNCQGLRPILTRLYGVGGYQEKIAALRSMANYSDTMETVCEKLEAF
jgi:UDP-N-acetylglucosamine:LPS N-acetylglucosamine transferase